MGQLTLTTTLSGKIFFIGRVGLAVVSQCTKFEVFRFTHYKVVNGSAKCRKWGGLGRLGGHSRSSAISPFDRAHTTSYSTLIGSICVYRVPFSRYSRLFAESRRFWPTPPAFGAPVVVTPVEFRGDLWHHKTRVPGLSCGVVCVIVRLAVLVEHRLVTDGRTDGRTQGHG